MIAARYVLALVAHLGFMVVYGLRVNMSVAIIAMVNSTYANAESSGALNPECRPYSNTTTVDKDGSLKWDQDSQGIILSSFFYGYIVVMFPSAILCSYFKATTMFGLGILFTSILTLLTPVVANFNYNLLIALRVAEGLCEGVTFPTMHSILSKWACPSEVTFLATIVYTGTATGTFIALSTSGFLCNSDFLGGWPSVFYIFGFAGILWYILWFSLIYELPTIHPRISDKEKAMLLKSVVVKPRTRHDHVPWKTIFTSLPVWSIFIINFCGSWYLYTLLTGLPLFFKEVLNFPLRQNGIFSALPYVFSPIFAIFSGWLCDWLISHGFLSRTVARKLFALFGLTIALGLTTMMTFCGCSQIVLIVCLLVVGNGFYSFGSAHYTVNQIDLAPRYADILMGISNTGGTLAGCLAPLVIGALTEDKPTRGQWKKVMFISSGLALFGVLTYLLFGQGKLQPWADGSQNNENVDIPDPINTDFIDSTNDTDPLTV